MARAILTPEERAARRKASYDKWRRENPEKAKAAQDNYRRNNPDKRKASTMKWRANNREQMLATMKRWHEANPDKRRQYNVKAWYGISLEEYDSMLKSQGNRCAICRSEKPRGKGRFAIDHDHATGKVRGLLCHGCNTGIGGLGDSVENLAAAIRYLAGHNNAHAQINGAMGTAEGE